jgi:hypothetical protein
MSRTPLAFAIRCCWRPVLFFCYPLGPLLLVHWVEPGWPVLPLLLFWLLAILVGSTLSNGLFYGVWRGQFWLWRFCRRVLRFRTFSSGSVVVYYPSGLDATIDFAAVAQVAESELADITEQFGFSLGRRLALVAFPSSDDLAAIFGRPMGGTALVTGTAVVLATDGSLREGLRHELVHLFAARWNLFAPPLLQEGLATWLQSDVRYAGFAPDAGCLLGRRPTDLEPLLGYKTFFAEADQHRCYALAADFTGYLIRRYGWERYRQFYRKCKSDGEGLRDCFVKHFGLTLDLAWGRCFEEALSMTALMRCLREDWLFNPFY